MHIHNIAMSTETKGPFTNAIAEVTIVDANNVAVQGATVSGHWSGLTDDTDEGVTDASGKVSLKSDKLKNPIGTFTFTVDNVEKTNWTYDFESNVETTDSIEVSSGAPALVRATGLENAYPILANPEIWIPFTLSEPERVVIKIYNEH